MSTSGKQHTKANAQKGPGAGRRKSPLKNNGASPEAVLHREALDLFRSVVNESNDAIFIVDPETSEVLYANARAASNLGYSQAELASLRVTDFGTHVATMDDWRSYMDRIRRDGYAFFESHHRRKDGSLLPVEVNARIIRHVAREYFISIVRDLSARKQREEDLRRHEVRLAESNNLLHLVLDTIPVRIFWKDTESNYLGCNRLFVQDAGRKTAEEMIGRTDYDMGWREQADRYRRDDREVMTTGTAKLNYEEPQTTPQGDMIWLRTSKIPLRGVDGKIIGVLGTYEDITNAKVAEERLRNALREAQQERAKTEAVVAAIGDGISIQDSTFRVLYQNENHKRITGEQVGNYCYQAYENRDHVCDGCPVVLAYADGGVHRVERSMPGPEGRRYYEITASPLRDAEGKIMAGIEVVRDVTERRMAEEALRESEDRFRHAFDDAPIGMALVGLDGRFLRVNRALCDILGYREDELLSRTVEAVTHPDDRDAEQGHKSEMIEGRKTAYQMVKRYLHADGHTVWGKLSVSYVAGASDRPLYFIGQLEDITDQRTREEEQQKLLAIIENNSDFIALAAPDGRVLYVNPAGRRMVGLDSPEQVQQTRIEDYHMAADRQQHGNVIMPKFRESGHWRGEYRFRHFTTGQPVPVEVNAFVIRDPSGAPFALAMIARDISERMKLEAQLVQSQKMESVGRLAGGIAHDFNNILTAIIGYSELLLMQLAVGNPMRHNVESIRESADRAAALTNQLLAFSRQQVLEMQVVDLNGVIEGMFGMLRRMIGEDVTLDLRLAPKARNVMADPGQISQVVMNLAVNARDAMPGGGRLTIATEDLDLSADEAAGLGLEAGAYVVASVADTGHGMSDAVMDRIFDPFFTTKEVGKGTGLGLATAYGIVKQHNGHIAVESEVNAGSVFRIYLPVAAGGVATMPAPKPLNMPRGSETIMLVEDEPALLQLMTTIIGSLGYRVLTAADGRQALKIAEQHSGPVHVLLTDVIMPGMNGRTLADRFMKQHPETRVVYMSGYTEDFIAHHGVLEEGRVLVRKPLKPRDLAEKLREVLDQP